MKAASIWGLVALRLADDEILPFDYVSYASELKVFLIIIISPFENDCLKFMSELVYYSLLKKSSAKVIQEEAAGCPISFSTLYKSIEDLKRAAVKIGKEKQVL